MRASPLRFSQLVRRDQRLAKVAGVDGPVDIRRDLFAVPGLFVQEHGGPSREGETLPSVPARYSGSVNGSVLQLSVRLESGGDAGSFLLQFGRRGELLKCL